MHVLRLLIVSLILALTWAAPARAISLLRDPDIEYALKQLAAPILKAAGLSPSRIDILVVDDRSLNAFVVDQNHIFLNSGLILKMKSPAMLQSVIAHEAGHIANGHLMRRPINLRNARTAAGIGAVLAAVGGAAAGNGALAAGAAAGVQGSALRSFFAHTRAEENAADQSGLRYMATAGIDTNGAVQVIDLFRGQEALSVGRRDPYASTHPLSTDRSRTVNQLASAYAGKAKPQPSSDYWFARAKGKLSAFKRSPKWTLTRAGESGFDDVKYMRQAAANHQRSKTKKAMNAINKAIQIRPKDPYYYELKGQILMESRQFTAAASAYGTAANLAPNNALILGAYGRSLMALGKVKQATQYLEKSRALDSRDIRVMRNLASAYASQGNNGMASLVTAERYALSGRLRDAGVHAKRASDLLPRGSTGWRRAQDVLAASEAASKKRRKK